MAYKKHPGGKPPKYKTAAQMQEKIDAYFTACEGEPLTGPDGVQMFDKHGNELRVGCHPPTITGLALALGFASRQSLLDYQAKREFLDTITRAKARCEQYAEERLFDRDGTSGAQFSLKNNFGWGAAEKEKDPTAQQNEMQSLADLLQHPLPDRNIKDFET